MPTISPGQTATLTLVNFGPPAELFINQSNGAGGYGAYLAGDTSCPQTVGGWTIANFTYNSGTGTIDLTVASNAAGGNYEMEYGNAASGNVRGSATFTVPGSSGGGGVPVPTLSAIGVLVGNVPQINLSGH